MNSSFDSIPPLPRAPSETAQSVISIRQLRSHCSTCSMRELCLPVGLRSDELRQVDDAVADRVRLLKGRRLYGADQSFHALYAVRVGSLKTVMPTEDGGEQVAGYHMAGDIIGLDGIGSGYHGCSAVALEDTEVCVIPFAELESLARKVPGLQRNLHLFMAREITRDHGVMLWLGSQRADARLATYLVGLSDRYRARGYSPVEFVLRMTREEIGSYIGLTLETVSRLFSSFQQQGLIRVQRRSIRIVKLQALRQLCAQR